MVFVFFADGISERAFERQSRNRTGPHAFANISAAKLRHAVPTVWMIVMERETERAGFFLVVSAYVDTLYSFIFFTA